MRVVKFFISALSVVCILSVVARREALSENLEANPSPPAVQAAPVETQDTVTPQPETVEQTVKKQDIPGATSKPEQTAKKRSSVHKWWVSGKAAPGHAAATRSASKKKAHAKKSTKSTKKKSSASKKLAVDQKKTCSGPVLSMGTLKKVMSGNKDLSGKNLSRMNLVGVKLAGANLRGACLAKANMERADLAEADLERAELSGANLTRSSLRLANINAAKLDGATLDNAIWTDSRVCLEGSIGMCRDVIPQGMQ